VQLALLHRDLAWPTATFSKAIWLMPANFFTLWRDADPDIPILKQAKAEYEKLQ